MLTVEAFLYLNDSCQIKIKMPYSKTNATQPNLTSADPHREEPGARRRQRRHPNHLHRKFRKSTTAPDRPTLFLQRYLFPRYPLFAEKLFRYLHAQCKAKTNHIGKIAFQQQCEKFLAILDDETARDVVVRMFAVENEDGSGEIMTPDSMRSLLMCAYHVSMDHYSEGPQMCLAIGKTLKAVVDGCFHVKTQISVQYVSHWLGANCPRLLLPLHRYAVHCLATSYRSLEADGPPLATGGLTIGFLMEN